MRFVAARTAGTQAAGSWLARMPARNPGGLVAISLANKIAGVARALMRGGGVLEAPAAA